jgi:hypothetical protein
MKQKQVEKLIMRQQKAGISNERIAHTLIQGARAGYLSYSLTRNECEKLGCPISPASRYWVLRGYHRPDSIARPFPKAYYGVTLMVPKED